MARGSFKSGGGRSNGDYWPGFVDALASLLLVLIFVLTIFFLAQFFLGQALSGKDSALARLNSRIAELTNLLALARSEKSALENQIADLRASLDQETGKRAEADSQIAILLGELETAKAGGSEAEAKIVVLQSDLDKQTQISAEALAQVELLNQQLAALRAQLASLEAALEAAEARDKENQAVIADLGKRLNAALAQKVQELQSYRSDFFGKLREILGDRPDVIVVGDRFILPSEIFFESGSAEINEAGKRELKKIADVIIELSEEIPGDVPWVLRVDGHTDKNPISTPQYPSNWHLSADRALNVVLFLIEQGVPAERLVPAGFGEYHPWMMVRHQTPFAAIAGSSSS